MPTFFDHEDSPSDPAALNPELMEEAASPVPKVSRNTEKVTEETESPPEQGHLSSRWPAENGEAAPGVKSP